MKVDNSISLNLSRFKIVLFTILLNIVAVIIFAHAPWSNWRTGMALNLLDNSILIAFVWTKRDSLLGHLLVFGLVLGFSELLADAWLVDYTRTLDYSIGGGPMLWRSPLWMPFAWEIVAVQFAVLGEWLVEKFKNVGFVLAGLAGAINIPFYEEMALPAKWWAYHHCRMIFHTPYYIILGEFLIVICIVVLGRRVKSLRWENTLIAGVLGGLSIFVCYTLAFRIFI